MARPKGTANGEKGVSKMGLVREALEQLGGEAKPKDIYEHVRSKHGVEIPTTMISSRSAVTSGGPWNQSPGSRPANHPCRSSSEDGPPRWPW